MKIIQITDLHIHPVEDTVNGVNTKKNLQKVLQAVANIDYDMVAITGDLCFSDGNEDVYFWIKEQLEKYEIKNYHVIGGNHDNAKALAVVFEKTEFLNKDELYYSIDPNIIFLDTIKGYCSKNQLKWFKETMSGIKEQNPVIFMHHPPFKSGVPHMDNKYAFQQSEEFSDICNTNTKTSYVFCGHYHNEVSVLKDNINIYITPSTYVQIDMFEEDFKAYHTFPGFRIIDIDNSELKTTVRYVFD